MAELRNHAPLFFLTDFGLSDPFAGVMKAVVLGLGHRGALVDLTHLIPPQNVLAGAIALEDAAPWLPAGSVVCAVVDPGVGASRRALAAEADGRFWIGPDNGLLAPALDAPGARLVEIAPGGPIDPSRSATFHGRDVFAPAAALLAMDPGRFGTLGPPVADPIRLAMPRPEEIRPGAWRLTVLAVDHFGNLATNLRRGGPGPSADVLARASFQAGGQALGPLRRTYADARSGEPVVYFNSAGRLEIAIRDGNAASRWDWRAGDFLTLL
jgi:S-adenosylmethionine hydrolase